MNAPLLLAGLLLAVPAAAQSWTTVTANTTAATTSVAVDPTDDDHVVFLLSQPAQSLLETIDGGQSWSTVALPAVAQFSHATEAAFQSDGRLFVLGGTGWASSGQMLAVRREFNGAWSVMGPSAPSSGFENVVASSLVSTAGGVLAMAVTGTDLVFFWSNTRVYYSVNDGATWQSTNSNWYGGAVRELAVGRHGSHSERLFYSIADTTFGGGDSLYSFDVASAQLVGLLSTNGSASIPATGRVMDEVVYVAPGDFAQPESMRQSFDGGDTWTQFATPGITTHLLRGHVDPQLLVRKVALQPLTISRDGGATWMPVPSGVGELRPPLAIAHDDSRLYVQTAANQYAYINLAGRLGSVECTSLPNGTGAVARLAVLGSSSVADRDLLLWAYDMLPAGFGLFIASRTASAVPAAGGSFGLLCLGGTVSRIGQPGLFGGLSGEFSYRLDVDAIPSPNGTTAIQPGDTWRFQAWFRDQAGGVSGSNFTDAVAVTFQP